MLKKLAESKWVLVVILALGLLLRVYNARETFLYGHDQDLAGWIIKDILVNHHPRLIGQLTSTDGIFIGPIFYYFLIPFYLLTKMDPIGGVLAVSVLGVATIASYYFVFSKVFGKVAGMLAGLIYAVSYYMVFNDREVVPTMPVMLWSVWYFWALNLLLKGKRLGYLVSGLLLGLIWHINMSLILVTPLIPLSVFFSKKKISWRGVVRAVAAFVVLSIPLIVFELRHSFPQVQAFISALTTNQKDIVSGADKFNRVLQLLNKNAHSFLTSPLPISHWAATLFFWGGLFYLWSKKIIDKRLAIVMIAWIGLFIVFFAGYSKIVSEYYLNGVMVIWLGTLTLTISLLLSRKKTVVIGLALLSFFVAGNLYRIFTRPLNKSGYLERKALVREIKRDAQEKGYPCVAVSYITKPGYELGYRYLFYIQGMHVNRPESQSPVYTIVFPLDDVLFPVHKTFGALGLIYPDYKRYTKEGVAQSCSGQNQNLEDSMFGYTE